jgi:hypothetical protein
MMPALSKTMTTSILGAHMIRIFTFVLISIFPVNVSAQGALDDFAASLLCTENCPEVAPPPPPSAPQDKNIIDGVSLPNDADMTKPDILRLLVKSGRYLSMDGSVRDIAPQTQDDKFVPTAPRLQTSRDQIPEASSPTPFIIDPRDIKTR